jgi:hypothetical protein
VYGNGPIHLPIRNKSICIPNLFLPKHRIPIFQDLGW